MASREDLEMDEEQDVSEQDAAPLSRRKVALLKLRRLQTEHFFKVADEVSVLAQEIERDPEINLGTWLHREAGFALAEAKTYVLFNEQYSGAEERREVAKKLKRGRASHATVHALVRCSLQVRLECLSLLGRGLHIDARGVERIRRKTLDAKRSAEVTARKRRRELLQQAEAKVGRAAGKSLQGGAAELLSLLDQIGVENSADDNAATVGARSTALIEVLSKKARDVIATMERLFLQPKGYRHSIYRLWEQGTAGQSMANSWRRLHELSHGDFSLDNRSFNDRFEGVRACMEFLAGKRWSAISPFYENGELPKIETVPTFVDIDVGCGGTALGLQAAGFKALAVFAGRDETAKSIQENRPFWKVFPHNLSNEFKQELEGLKNSVDLLTSGLPWDHYRNVMRTNALSRAKSAVEIVSPKVFVFEALSVAKNEAKEFEALGYDVKWHSVDVSNYGIAQSKTRHVLVGIRDKSIEGFSVPTVSPPRRKGLGQVIGRLVGRHKWDGTEDPAVRTDFQKAVETWAATWADELAPELPVGARNKKKDQWSRLGVDIEDFANLPPTPQQLGKLFKLDSEMLKAIHGIPRQWKVQRAQMETVREIASSFPPTAAKMLGLAIHSKLTGVQFDYERAVDAPLLYLRRSAGSVEYLPEWISTIIIDPNRAFRDRERALVHARLGDVWSWHPITADTVGRMNHSPRTSILRRNLRDLILAVDYVGSGQTKAQ
ncbi:DNA cytosine methyltransferase [Rhizobium sp. 16-449-1b]|uniref:DNA cytosine methyltransferase n=1 Tax=Rhizobium sp. 16-449-1b TaxID=2819989 RepID=UPI001ADD2062|nr:DNA cytosine methyltransferase [Rhizobium sp. 16-449-1b]MBO9198138.1 DNA cytosine methyltransferase [Rhizobium sp. 16-449-1b]